MEADHPKPIQQIFWDGKHHKKFKKKNRPREYGHMVFG
jgi:hypothetical protein